MADDEAFRSTDEFADAIPRLTKAESARLRQAAHYLAQVVSIEADDLLQEAITRGLEGRRRWPAEISIVRFLAMVMKSLVSGERKKAGLRPERDPDDEGDPDMYPDTSPEGLGRRADEILISEERRRSILGLFEGDPQAQLIIEGMLGGMEGEELREFVELDPTEYASKRRKIRRTLNKAHGAGRRK